MIYWIKGDFPANDIADHFVDSLETCMQMCLDLTACVAFTYDSLDRWAVNCWLKDKGDNYEDDGTYSNGLIGGGRCSYDPVTEPTAQPDGKYPTQLSPSKGKCLFRKTLDEVKIMFHNVNSHCKLQLLFF